MVFSNHVMKIFLKILVFCFTFVILLVLGFVLFAEFCTDIDPPIIEDQSIVAIETKEVSNHTYQLKNNWLRKDETGIWELYAEGSPFNRGFAIGKMCIQLLDYQEEVFTSQLYEIVPGALYRSFLIKGMRIYNRKLADFVPIEYQREIYGVSLSAPDGLDHIGSKYQRKLSFHAAHDIGHAFQNMGFVSGCTALTMRDSSSNGTIILGRNFDFYVGEEFAQNKIMSFIRPDNGYAFASISWPGMMGVVSGMNEKGICIALNAGPSDMPKGVKTPVTILAREILQYASTLDEAKSIALKRDVFVSENFIIASGREDQAIIIEKSPGSTSFFETTHIPLVCTNHFQTAKNLNISSNLSAQTETSSGYRFERVMELHGSSSHNKVDDLISILQNTQGLNNKNLGLGNELAINQLTGHHSIIFNPSKKLIYVAGVPSQIGPYFIYNLDSIFNYKYHTPQRLWTDTLPSHELLHSPSYNNFKNYRRIIKKIVHAAKETLPLSAEEISDFIKLNPNHYEAYMHIGDYFVAHNNCAQALTYWNKALHMPIPWERDRHDIQIRIEKCK